MLQVVQIIQLSVKSNDGIKIGTGGQLSLGIDGETGVIQHNTSGSSIDVRMRNGNLTPTVLSINSDGNVGFNNAAPEQTIDVKGNIKISPKTGEAETGVYKLQVLEILHQLAPVVLQQQAAWYCT